MNTEFFFVLLAFIFTFIAPVAAWGAGDTVALILGIVILIVALCAGLGWWSRRT